MFSHLLKTSKSNGEGIERLDPVWVQPSGASSSSSAIQNSLKTGERFIARSPPGSVLENVLLQPNERHVLKFTIQIPPAATYVQRSDMSVLLLRDLFVQIKREVDPIVIEMPLKVHAGLKAEKLGRDPRSEDLRISETFKR